jgi:aryl-phospho-beta-D-glucosidase BglC (GH1 family)
MRRSLKTLFRGVTVSLALAGVAGAQSADSLPRWRGFNLLEKFMVHSNKPFAEDDFRWISELGFNFVRLPMDYRCWIVGGDWRKFNEDTLKEIDQAVEYGRKYSIHVSLNFHRGPGYTVASPKEPRDLWTDPEAQEVCALHWAAFARRYKGIPNSRLSFDLLNEPGQLDGPTYFKVAKILVEAIRKEDPERLIIADGAFWGNKPVPELIPLRIAQSTRGYQPMGVSHFRANWIGGWESMPAPTWPLVGGMNPFLYGNGKPELQTPLVLKGGFSEACDLGITVNVVSSKARLVVKADGQTVLDKLLESGPGQGEWKKVVYVEPYKVYQNVFDREYVAKIPAGTKEVRLENADGDWMTFSGLRLKPWPGAPGGEASIPAGQSEWGKKQETHEISPAGKLSNLRVIYDRSIHWKEQIEPWKELQKKGVGVHVGEWGAFNRTPHDITLAWMEDLLKNWKEAGWGWALWNFRGGFGILDSDRKDVAYEDFRGHKLDRKMLELIKRY